MDDTQYQIWKAQSHQFHIEDIKSVAEEMGVADKLNDTDYDIIAGNFEDDHDIEIADLVQYEQHISDYLHYQKGEE